MKDYYRILGIKPNANVNDIKKAYRKLAVQYHPDKNPGNAFSNERFIEINEAYSTLSDPAKRKWYDDERFYAGIFTKKEETITVTASWLANVTQQLNASLGKMDIHRMSHGALQQYILLIISPAHIAILHLENNEEQNAAIIAGILKASRHLEAKYLPAIENKLKTITNDPEQLSTIEAFFNGRDKEAFFKRIYPYVILLITLFMCLLMYYYGNWKAAR